MTFIFWLPKKLLSYDFTLARECQTIT